MSVSIQAADGSGAAPSVRDFDGSGNNFVCSQHRLVFSGSYPGTPGEALDLSPLFAVAPSGLAPLSGYVEGNGDSSSLQGNGGYYGLSLFNGASPVANAPTANKVRAWVAAGTEIPTAAYPASVLRDAVTLFLTWKKLSS